MVPGSSKNPAENISGKMDEEIGVDPLEGSSSTVNPSIPFANLSIPPPSMMVPPPGVIPGITPGMAPNMAPGITPGMAPNMAPGIAPGMVPAPVPTAPKPVPKPSKSAEELEYDKKVQEFLKKTSKPDDLDAKIEKQLNSSPKPTASTRKRRTFTDYPVPDDPSIRQRGK